MTKQISNGVNKTTVMGIVIAIIVFGGIVLLARPDSQMDTTIPLSSTSNGNLEAEEMSFDFGTISMKDGDVSHIFALKNEGEEMVIIEKIYTSCMCTTAYITDSSGRRYGEFGMQGHGGPSRTAIEVGPGESAAVEAIFDPAAHGPSGVGLAERSVYIETNSLESPKIELRLTALVIK